MKTVILITLAAVSAAVGETMLSYAMKRTGQLSLTDPSHWSGLIVSIVRNPYIFAGVVFLAVYFFLYLIALSWADLSFVLPLTAISYIVAALLARLFLNEEVTWLRWAGTIIITLGIVFIAIGGKSRTAQDQGAGAPHSSSAMKAPER